MKYSQFSGTDEVPLFFPRPDGGDLFGVYHAPARSTGLGFVFCHPYAEEKLWAHRCFVSTARRLAARGVAVLRFDVYGHGDSDGDFADATLDTAVDDTVAAVQALRELRPGLDAVGLLGLRLGAAVACLAWPRIDDGGPCVLWQPVSVGDAYIQEVLRSHLSAQMAMDGKVSVNRKQLLECLDQGESVNIEGYEFTPAMRRSLEGLDLREGGALDCDALIAEVVRREQPVAAEVERLASRFRKVKCEQFQLPPFWRETREYVQAPQSLLASTLGAVEETA